MKYRHGSSGSEMSTGFAWFVIICWVVICAFAWPYTINAWLVYAGKAPTIVWWQGACIGFIPYIGRITIAAMLITWVMLNWIL